MSLACARVMVDIPTYVGGFWHFLSKMFKIEKIPALKVEWMPFGMYDFAHVNASLASAISP